MNAPTPARCSPRDPAWWATLDVGFLDRPLVEEAWLWALAHERALRIQPWAEPLPAWTSVAKRWAPLMERMAQRWCDTPLVWQNNDGVVQAVLLGQWRFTWSVDEPAGRWEHRHALSGWSVCASDGMLLVLRKLFEVPVDDTVCSSFIAQALEGSLKGLQHHEPREWGWPGPVKTGSPPSLSWSPFNPMDHAPNLGSLVNNLRRNLMSMVAHISTLDPFWSVVKRVVRRLMQRSSSDPWRRMEGPRSSWDNVFLRLTQHWSAWKDVMHEHPRAELMLAWAVDLDLLPGLHTWRDDVWTGNMGWTPAVCKAWREALPSFLQNLQSMPQGKEVLQWVWKDPERDRLMALPPGLWRRLGHVLWAPFGSVDRTGGPSEAWQQQCRRELINICLKRPWLAQRTSMPAWWERTQEQWAWLRDQDENIFDRRAWGWKNVERTILKQRQKQALPTEWPKAWATTTYDGMVIQQITSREQSRLVGEDLKNCFRSSHSDSYVRFLRHSLGLLFLLKDQVQTKSLLYVEYDYPKASWLIHEHLGTANTEVNDHHTKVARCMVIVLNACIMPEGWVSDVSDARLDDMPALNEALLPTWGQRFDNVPSIVRSRNPLRRCWQWLNDDEWWTGFTEPCTTVAITTALILAMMTNALHTWFSPGSSSGFAIVGSILDVMGTFILSSFTATYKDNFKNKIRLEQHIRRQQRPASFEEDRHGMQPAFQASEEFLKTRHHNKSS